MIGSIYKLSCNISGKSYVGFGAKPLLGFHRYHHHNIQENDQRTCGGVNRSPDYKNNINSP